MASVTKIKRKKGYRYRASVRVKGHTPEHKTFDTRREAEEWGKKREAELKYFSSASTSQRTLVTQPGPNHTSSFPRVLPTADITFGEFLDRFIEHLLTDPTSTKDKNNDYIKNKLPKIKWWKAKLGDRHLSEITDKLLKRMFDAVFYEDLNNSSPPRIKSKRRKEPRANATFRKYYFALSVAFQFGMDHEYVESNPVRPVTESKTFRSYKPAKRERILEGDELPRLMEACRKVDSEANRKLKAFNKIELVVMLLLATGKRKQSVLNLEWTDIDLKNRYFIIRDLKSEKLSATGTEAQGTKKIELKEDGLLLKKLREHFFSRNPDSTFLFPSKDGTKPRDVRKPFMKALEIAGIADFVPHDCRHDFATALRDAGVEAGDIGDALGVKSMQTVFRYAHGNDERVNEIRLSHQEDLERRIRG